MRLRRYDRSLHYAHCTCKAEDAVCRFPSVGDLVVPHHAYCLVFKAVNRCFYQRMLWIEASKIVAAKECRGCCKNCVIVGSMSGHCIHCRRDKEFLRAQTEAVMWGHMMHMIVQRDRHLLEAA